MLNWPLGNDRELFLADPDNPTSELPESLKKDTITKETGIVRETQASSQNYSVHNVPT